MTEAEAIEHCKLSDEQIAVIPTVSRLDEDGNAKRGRPPQDMRLGYALQLAFLALTGRLAGATDSFPSSMVKVLANQVGVNVAAIATIKSIYRGKAGPQSESSVERRLREQRTWARETLGFQSRRSARYSACGRIGIGRAPKLRRWRKRALPSWAARRAR